MDPDAKREALLDAKNLISEISVTKKSRRKRGGEVFVNLHRMKTMRVELNLLRQ